MSCVVWGFVHFGSGLGNALASQSLASQSLANILQKNLSQQQTNNTPQASLSVSSHLMRVVWQLPGVEEVPPPTLLRLRERALFSSWLASKPPCCSKPPKPTLPSLLFNPCTSIQQAGKPRSCCWSHHPRPLLPLIQSALPHPPSLLSLTLH